MQSTTPKRPYEEGAVLPSGELSDAAVLAPISYIQSLPSKLFLERLVKAINVWLNVPDEVCVVISSVVETIKTCSLILDDIEDGSPLRRGSPAVHTIFGPAQAINSATYLFLRALSELSALKSLELLDSMLRDLETLFRGQSWDLHWTFHGRPPSQMEYLAMIDGKTGSFFHMLARMMQHFSPKKEQSPLDFKVLSQTLAHFFQIRDDYMNLVSESYHDQKGFADDLDEGKFSFPLILAINANPTARDHILGLLKLRQRPLPLQAKRYILSLMQDAGALAETLETLRALECKLEEEIGRLEHSTGVENSLLRMLLKMLSVKQMESMPPGPRVVNM
jgi:ophiobolin F synthase